MWSWAGQRPHPGAAPAENPIPRSHGGPVSSDTSILTVSYSGVPPSQGRQWKPQTPWQLGAGGKNGFPAHAASRTWVGRAPTEFRRLLFWPPEGWARGSVGTAGPGPGRWVPSVLTTSSPGRGVSMRELPTTAEKWGHRPLGPADDLGATQGPGYSITSASTNPGSFRKRVTLLKGAMVCC